jgi:hypothetical protein
MASFAIFSRALPKTTRPESSYGILCHLQPSSSNYSAGILTRNCLTPSTLGLSSSLGSDPKENIHSCVIPLLPLNGPQRKPQFLRLLGASSLLSNVLPLLTSLAHSVHITIFISSFRITHSSSINPKVF